MGLLETLLDRNADHVERLADDALAACREGQHPPVVSVSCSDSRVPQDGMWAVDEPNFLFTAGNIGNRVRDTVDGRPVLDGSVAYPLTHAGTEVVVVVGHTGCGAVGAALEAVRSGKFPPQPGVRADVAEIVPVVEVGLETYDMDPYAPDTHDRLVEYNVHRQVEHVRNSDEAADADVYGFVYDLHHTYGDRDGVTYLVNVDGERDPETLADAVPDRHADRVVTLL